MVLELLSSNTCYFLWLGKMVGLVMSSRENGRYYFFIWVLNLMSDLIGGGGVRDYLDKEKWSIEVWTCGVGMCCLLLF